MLTHFAYPCRDTPFVDAEHADQCALHKMYIHKCRYASESKQYMYVCVYLYTYIYIYTCLFICQKAYLQSRTSTKTQNTSEPRCKHVCAYDMRVCLSACLPPPPACLEYAVCMHVCMWHELHGKVWFGMACYV